VGLAHHRVPVHRHRGDEDRRRRHAAPADGHHLARQLMSGPSDVPEAAPRRLESGSFSSGLTVPDFAACLQMGLRPVGLVQGFCAMQWGWYGGGSRTCAAPRPTRPGGSQGGYSRTGVPARHGVGRTPDVGPELRADLGRGGLAEGFTSAYTRLIEEAREVGAHGVIGVPTPRTTCRHERGRVPHPGHRGGRRGRPATAARRAVVDLSGRPAPGQADRGRVHADLGHRRDRVGACVGLLHDRVPDGGAGRRVRVGPDGGTQEIEQISEGHLAARSLAREHAGAARVRHPARHLHHDTEREVGAGDQVLECMLRGTRVRRFKDFDPMPAPRPTVRSRERDPQSPILGQRCSAPQPGWPRAATVPAGRGVTSDLSIDEALLLHSIGWEPVELVFGVAVTSVPTGRVDLGAWRDLAASDAHNLAVQVASEKLGHECAAVGGHGVVGVRVSVEVRPPPRRRRVDRHGRSTGRARRPLVGRPFVSDLSARDFVLLSARAGTRWAGLRGELHLRPPPSRRHRHPPVRPEHRAHQPHRGPVLGPGVGHGAHAVLGAGDGAQGVVAVKITEGPMSFARHVIGFTAWGTAVRLEADSHVYLKPDMVLPRPPQRGHRGPRRPRQDHVGRRHAPSDRSLPEQQGAHRSRPRLG
jgi:uncharacterized protein YbjQ (UPF0145 family)